MFRLRGLAFLAFILMMLLSSITMYSASNYVFYIYGSDGCPHCTALKNYLNSWYGPSNVYFCGFEGNSSCVERFINFCADLGLRPSIPLTFVVVDGSVRAVVFGEVSSKSFWDSLLKLPESNDVPLYFGSELAGHITVSNLSMFSMVMVPEYYGVRLGNVTALLPLHQVLTLLAVLALSDSVNPCVIFIYTLLLIAASLALGRRGRVIAVGTSFILAIFIGYYVLGLGLMTVVRGFPKELLSLIAIAFGLWICISGIKGRSRVIAKKSVLGLISRASTSTTISFALGLLLTFTLLPCSAGPYVVFVGIASKYSTPIPYLLLATYNVIFVAPLLIISLIIWNTMKYKTVQEVILKHNIKLSLIAGLVLIVVGVWIALT